jgi:hypothetical protein
VKTFNKIRELPLWIFERLVFPSDYPNQTGVRVGPLDYTGRVVVGRILFQISYWFDQKLLKPIWFVKPISTETLTSATRGDLAEIAVVESSLNEYTLSASRLLRRSSLSHGIAVNWKLQSTQITKIGFINLAEDPRIFIFRNELWLYYQVANQFDPGCRMFIFNPLRNVKIELRTTKEFGGKNWIPFEFEGELFIVYSFEPFSLHKSKALLVGESDFLEFAPVESKLTFSSGVNVGSRDKYGIGAIRGGTPLVETEPGKFIGFTHINKGGKLEKSHQIGYVEIDLLNNELKHREITKSKHNLLTAPYGIDLLEDGLISVTYNCSVGSVHNQYQPITNRKSIFYISDLRQA